MSPFSVVIFVSQVFDNTPAALEGTLAAGDEITGVNGKTVKGKTKVEVAKMIQAVQVGWKNNHNCWFFFSKPEVFNTVPGFAVSLLKHI